MSTIGGALRSLSPHSLLRLYLAVVVGTAVIAISAVSLATSNVDSRSRDAASQANAAIADAQIQTGLREPLLTLVINSYSFLANSEGLASLSEAERAQVVQAIAGFNTLQEDPPPLPNVALPLSERDAIAIQRSIDRHALQVDELVAGAPDIDLSEVVAHRDNVTASLGAYLDDNSLDNFRLLFRNLLLLNASLDAAGDVLARNVSAQQAGIASATQTARVVMLASVLVLVAIMAVATMLVSRLIHQAFVAGEREREALKETTKTLQYRNDQLSALYAVFSEITDTLSMRYVISATLRETLRVMNCQMVVLRLLHEGNLEVVGNLTSAGKEIKGMPPVPLGEGPTGRVARRGRSLRITHGAQGLLGPSPEPDDPDAGVESGIIVPLIVGARVVGTLACWAKDANAFSEEDERVLEMMASQVATAVVAADHAETSERRAMHDPLTGLPNRRQLSEDITGDFAKFASVGQHAAVLMIDVDNFKRLNDDFGHRVGDVSLQKVASVMRAAMREHDVIYRYGGEEFIAIIKGAGGRDAVHAAERLREAVEATPLTGDQLEPIGPLTISVGVALLPEHGIDIHELIERADKAMYRAKVAGRNRVEVWQEDMSATGLPTVA
jgi:diguanylate cyclase (GGDEF)-like protein